MKSIRAFLADDRGATMVEYGILIALIAVVAIVIIATVGNKVSKVFQDLLDKLGE